MGSEPSMRLGVGDDETYARSQLQRNNHQELRREWFFAGLMSKQVAREQRPRRPAYQRQSK